MIRYEIQTPHKFFTGCEPTLAKAKAYVDAMAKTGVDVIEANYFDNESRIEAIREGRF